MKVERTLSLGEYCLRSCSREQAMPSILTWMMVTEEYSQVIL